MKAGSFDIVDAESSNKRARQISLFKTGLIVFLLLIVAILAIKLGMDATSSHSNDNSSNGESHDHRPLHPRDRAGPNKRQVCYSAECIKKSSSLFQSMNLTADPCQDFNEYACGNFVRNSQIPDDKGRWTNFGVISERIYERGRSILEEPIQPGTDWETFKKAKMHYKACMDEGKREELGLKPLQDYLAQIGGWPVLEGGEAWTKSAEWYETIYKLNEAGFGKNYLVAVSVGTDDKDSSSRKIHMDKPSLGMSREYLVKGLEDKDVQSYFTYMKEMAVLFGASQEKAESELRAVVELEIKLANATLPREKRRNSTLLYNPFILGEYEVLEGHPQSWSDYIDKILFR